MTFNCVRLVSPRQLNPHLHRKRGVRTEAQSNAQSAEQKRRHPKPKINFGVRITVGFGCQHGLRSTKNIDLVRYYNALDWNVVPPHGLEPRTY